MEMIQLKRFCYIGTLEPTFVLNRDDIDIKCRLKELRRICHSISDSHFLDIMRSVLDSDMLPRRNEALFAYAVYLTADLLNENWRHVVRKTVPQLIPKESDLFLFVKYVTLVQKARGHSSWVPRTVRKALVAWYMEKSLLSLKLMLGTRLRLHGFTHKVILKLCHIPDSNFDKATLRVIRAFFRQEAVTPTALAQPDSLLKYDLRLCEDVYEIVRTIKLYNLEFAQVPRSLLGNDLILAELIQKMEIRDILNCMQYIIRYHLSSFCVIRKVHEAFRDKRRLGLCNVHPVNYLFYDHRLQMKLPRNIDRILKTMEKPRESLHFLRHVYYRSFGLNKPLGLRMHITIDLAKCDQKKTVHGTDKKMLYQDAMMGLAFGYYNVEDRVSVACWNEVGELVPINWRKNMKIKQATRVVKASLIPKSKQLLLAPILNAYHKKEVYDVFLVIVPVLQPEIDGATAASTLKHELGLYRSTTNMQARYILVNLCLNSTTAVHLTKETRNVLQLCGLNEHTTNIITAFASDLFS